MFRFNSILPAFVHKWWFRIFFILYTAAMVALSIPRATKISTRSDHWVFWQTGKDFFENQDLYSHPGMRPVNTTPFTAFLCQPIHILPLQVSANIRFLINALLLIPLCFLLIYNILINTRVPPEKAQKVILFSFLLSFKYIWNNLIMFQVNQFIFLFILAGIYFLSRKKSHWAGAIFVFITMIKIIPVFLAAYVFLHHFSKKVVLYMGTTLLICLLLPAAFRGLPRHLDDYHQYYETFLKEYVVDGKIVADPVNHNLKGAVLKAFHPETGRDPKVDPGSYPITFRLVGIFQFLLLGMLIITAVVSHRRGVYMSHTVMASIILFTHLYSGITWTAHLVTLSYCLVPILLIDPGKLDQGKRILFYLAIGLIALLSIEGSDTLGKTLYHMIRQYDIYTMMLLSIFGVYTWAELSGRSMLNRYWI